MSVGSSPTFTTRLSPASPEYRRASDYGSPLLFRHPPPLGTSTMYGSLPGVSSHTESIPMSEMLPPSPSPALFATPSPVLMSSSPDVSSHMYASSPVTYSEHSLSAADITGYNMSSSPTRHELSPSMLVGHGANLPAGLSGYTPPSTRTSLSPSLAGHATSPPRAIPSPSSLSPLPRGLSTSPTLYNVSPPSRGSESPQRKDRKRVSYSTDYRKRYVREPSTAATNRSGTPANGTKARSRVCH